MSVAFCNWREIIIIITMQNVEGLTLGLSKLVELNVEIHHFKVILSGQWFCGFCCSLL